MIISFEGIDTAGKSTQCELLKNNLEKENKKVKVLHFPNYDGVVGELINDILHDDKKINSIDKNALQYLYIADQMNSNDKINNLLDSGYTVILDRYDISTLVYSLASINKSILDDVYTKRLITSAKIQQAQSFLLKPDVTFILNLDHEQIEKRKDTHDSFEKNKPFMKEISSIYSDIECYIDNKRLIYKIDASKSIDDISITVYNYIKSLER